MIAEPTGTDGIRTIGRTWHASPWKNSSPAEVICLSTRNTLPLPHSQMIRSPLPLPIRCWYLCLATLTPSLILAGRSRPRQGEPLRRIAHDYGVSYEAVRRVLRAVRRD
jgi:hypothetical protein